MGNVITMMKKRHILLIVSICYFLILLMVIPTKTIIKDNFEVYQSTSSEHGVEFIELEFEYREYRRAFSRNDFKGHIGFKDSKYRFELLGEETQSRTWVRVRSPFIHFGDLLPGDDFSEFVLILKDNYEMSNGKIDLKYIAYPANTRAEAEELLMKLIEEHEYRPEVMIDE